MRIRAATFVDGPPPGSSAAEVARSTAKVGEDDNEEEEEKAASRPMALLDWRRDLPPANVAYGALVVAADDDAVDRSDAVGDVVEPPPGWCLVLGDTCCCCWRDDLP